MIVSNLNEHLSFAEKAKKEMREFLFCFAYFSFFFSAFVLYSNLLLFRILLGFFHYGFAIFEAFILAKLVLLGQHFKLGDKFFSNYPLIFPTIYKAIVFSIFVGLFGILEHYVGGSIRGKDLATLNHEFLNQGIQVIAARSS